MSTKGHVDVWRVLLKPDYAAHLTDGQWRELANDPDWREAEVEFPQLMDELYARFGSKVPGYGTGSSGAANPSLAVDELSVLGKGHRHVQGMGVVTGVGKYAVNLTVSDMLYMKTLRSPHPRALVKAIDTSKAEALRGVAMILHRFNLPEEYQDSRLEGGPKPRFLFDEEVTQVGAPVAAVAAESEHIADEAIHLIDVEYEVLPAVTNFLDGIKPGAPKLWDNEYDGTILDISEPLVRGDPDAGMKEAGAVVDAISTRSTEQNAPLELTSGICWWENERLTWYWTARHAHGERARMARALKLPSSRVRVIQTGYLGGSYGSHRNGDVSEVHAAILAKLTGKPVRATATRSEDFITRTVRAAVHTEGKLGVNRDGAFVAATYKLISDTGAGSSNRSPGAWIGLETLYNIPNLRLEGIGVYTNNVRSGSYRCVSHPYATLAQETLVDKAAYAVGMNPLEIRLKNVNEVGHPDTGKPYSNPGIRDCLTQAAERISWETKWHPAGAKEVRPGVFHGIGMAAHACSHGAGGHPSTGVVIVNPDGTVNVVSGAAEVGGGQRTVMAMIAAETLGIPYEQVGIAPEIDTDYTSDTGVTAGSRQTNSGGWGVYEAALDARRQLLEGAVQKFTADARKDGRTIEVTPEALDIRDGFVFFKDDPETKIPVADAVEAVVPRTPVIGRGAHFHPPTWERLAFAAHAAEVEVDTVTGSVSVLRYVAAHDVGRAMNPLGLEQQIQGGVTMGISAALSEGLVNDKATGLPLTDNILEYKALTIKDAPRNVEAIFVEHAKEYGVFGAHGIGEPPIAVAPPTIANAIYNAIGVWITSLPITRDKILAALEAA
ncbi:MAG TPA: hypothetical protein DEP84_23140 [Chloroflexi bacterium]|nr:hypothetical protein [Chloroflexota bacterium]